MRRRLKGLTGAGILTTNAIILVEAKWQSAVGAEQGKMHDKDQIQLRGEFLKKYGPIIFPNRIVYAVVGVSLFTDAFTDTTPDGIVFRSTTWERVCQLASHPQAEELRRYLKWKMEHTKTANIYMAFGCQEKTSSIDRIFDELRIPSCNRTS